MSQSLTKHFEDLHRRLTQDDIFSSPAELHGILCGLIAGGASNDKSDWVSIIADFLNDGLSFTKAIKTEFTRLFDESRMDLDSTEATFALVLPDDDEALSDRAEAVVAWVQGFLLGFGVHQTSLKSMSDDVKEIIHDFTEISKMSTEIEEDEEGEVALFEVIEYIRCSVMLCYAETGSSNTEQPAEKRTLH